MRLTTGQPKRLLLQSVARAFTTLRPETHKPKPPEPLKRPLIHEPNPTKDPTKRQLPRLDLGLRVRLPKTTLSRVETRKVATRDRHLCELVVRLWSPGICLYMCDHMPWLALGYGPLSFVCLFVATIVPTHPAGSPTFDRSLCDTLPSQPARQPPTHAQTRAHTHTRTCTWCVCVCVCVYIYILYICIYTDIHTYIHSYIHTNRHTHKQNQIQQESRSPPQKAKPSDLELQKSERGSP